MSFWGTVRWMDADALNRAAAELLQLLDGAEQGFPAASGREADARQRGMEAARARGFDGESRLLAEALDARSAENRRMLGAAPGTEAAPADGVGAASLSVSPAARSGFAGPGAERMDGGTDMKTAPPDSGAIERAYFDAEAVSEFFRRDSRRYDSGFGG